MISVVHEAVDRYQSLSDRGVIDYHKETHLPKLTELEKAINEFPAKEEYELRSLKVNFIHSIIFCWAMDFIITSKLQEKWNFSTNVSHLISLPITLIVCVLLSISSIFYYGFKLDPHRNELRRVLANWETVRTNLTKLGDPLSTITMIERNKNQLPAGASDEEILHFGLTGARNGKVKEL
jgi:hypothetical protein